MLILQMPVYLSECLEMQHSWCMHAVSLASHLILDSAALLVEAVFQHHCSSNGICHHLASMHIPTYLESTWGHKMASQKGQTVPGAGRRSNSRAWVVSWEGCKPSNEFDQNYTHARSVSLARLVYPNFCLRFCSLPSFATQACLISMETRLAGDSTAVCSQACVCLITQEAGSHMVPQQLAVMLSCLVSMGTAVSCF